MKNIFKVGSFPPKGSVQLEKLLSELKSLGFEYSELRVNQPMKLVCQANGKLFLGKSPALIFHALIFMMSKVEKGVGLLERKTRIQFKELVYIPGIMLVLSKTVNVML